MYWHFRQTKSKIRKKRGLKVRYLQENCDAWMLTVFKWSLLTKCNLYTLLKDSFKSVSSPGLFLCDLAQSRVSAHPAFWEFYCTFRGFSSSIKHLLTSLNSCLTIEVETTTNNLLFWCFLIFLFFVCEIANAHQVITAGRQQVSYIWLQRPLVADYSRNNRLRWGEEHTMKDRLWESQRLIIHRKWKQVNEEEKSGVWKRSALREHHSELFLILEILSKCKKAVLRICLICALKGISWSKKFLTVH